MTKSVPTAKSLTGADLGFLRAAVVPGLVFLTDVLKAELGP